MFFLEAWRGRWRRRRRPSRGGLVGQVEKLSLWEGLFKHWVDPCSWIESWKTRSMQAPHRNLQAPNQYCFGFSRGVFPSPCLEPSFPP